MSRTVVEFYAAAVCFCAVACLSIACGIVLYDVVAILNPGFTANPFLANPPPPNPMAQMQLESMGGLPIPPAPVQLSAEDESKRRQVLRDNALQAEAALSRQSALRWGIAALISAVLFAAHWRLLRRPRANSA